MALVDGIETYQADLLKSFAVFFLLILGNFVTGLFTCSQRNYINNSKTVMLIIAFLLFYFLVTLVSNTGNVEFIPPIERFLNTCFYFVIFVLSMRMDLRITLTIITLLLVIYFIELNKDYYLEMGSKITNMDEKSVYQDHAYWITLDYPFRIRSIPVKKEQFNIINKIEKILYYVIIVCIIFGLIAYRGEITDTLHKHKDLSWFDVFSDTKVCKIIDRESLTHYFKMGIGIKT
jgi:cell division protein FtsL